MNYLRLVNVVKNRVDNGCELPAPFTLIFLVIFPRGLRHFLVVLFGLVELLGLSLGVIVVPVGLELVDELPSFPLVVGQLVDVLAPRLSEVAHVGVDVLVHEVLEFLIHFVLVEFLGLLVRLVWVVRPPLVHFIPEKLVSFV